MHGAAAFQNCNTCTCAFTKSCLSTLANQLTAQKLVGLLAVLQDLRRQEVKHRIYHTTSVTMTREVSPHESSCLANCRLVCVSVHCCLVYVQSVQVPSVCACS